MTSRDEGSPNARIVLLSDAYGHWEQTYNRPLCGPHWTDKLLPWLRDVGLSREDCYITQVWDQGQPTTHADRISEHDWRGAMDRCHEKLAGLPGPDGNGPVEIVPLGEYALYTLTGNGKPSWHRKDGRHERPGLYDWRGSILRYADRRGRQIKVIPTLDPASTFFRDVGLCWALQMDWQRIAEDATFRELRTPQYTKLISPSRAEAIEWIAWCRAEAFKRRLGVKYYERLACSLDVETPNKVEYELRQKASEAQTAKCVNCGHTKRWHVTLDEYPPERASENPTRCTKKAPKKAGGEQCACVVFNPPLGKPRKVKISEESYLGCIGYAFDPKMALCIPTTLDYWQDPAVLDSVLGAMAAFHADENVDFGGQNFAFDAWWCWLRKMPLHAIGWDLMKMHRTQRPWSEWHNLAFQASLDTRQPFWKHEAKLPEEISRWSHNKAQLWDYNCVDNCVQIGLLPIRLAALKEGGRFEYHEEMEANVDTPLIELSTTGLRADLEGRAAECQRVREEKNALSLELNAVAGMPLVGVHKKTGVLTGKSPSSKKLLVLLYDHLRLPVQYKKVKVKGQKEKVKRPTADVVAIKRLMDRFPAVTQLQEVGKRTLWHRRLGKIEASLSESRVSPDGRVYGLFKQDTGLGRLSCGAPPSGPGDNLQNQDRKLRQFYLPDRGDE